MSRPGQGHTRSYSAARAGPWQPADSYGTHRRSETSPASTLSRGGGDQRSSFDGGLRQSRDGLKTESREAVHRLAQVGQQAQLPRGGRGGRAGGRAGRPAAPAELVRASVHKLRCTGPPPRSHLRAAYRSPASTRRPGRWRRTYLRRATPLRWRTPRAIGGPSPSWGSAWSRRRQVRRALGLPGPEAGHSVPDGAGLLRLKEGMLRFVFSFMEAYIAFYLTLTAAPSSSPAAQPMRRRQHSSGRCPPAPGWRRCCPAAGPPRPPRRCCCSSTTPGRERWGPWRAAARWAAPLTGERAGGLRVKSKIAQICGGACRHLPCPASAVLGASRRTAKVHAFAVRVASSWRSALQPPALRSCHPAWTAGRACCSSTSRTASRSH